MTSENLIVGEVTTKGPTCGEVGLSMARKMKDLTI
jgi:hypothetical protein